MRGKESWDQDRRTAALTGVLFIVGTVSGIASRGLLKQPAFLFLIQRDRPLVCHIHAIAG